MKIFYALASILLISSCVNTDTQNDQLNNFEAFYAPKPGTLIASDSIEIDDELNDFVYSAKILAGDASEIGRYNLKVSYGPNVANMEVVYPELTQQIIPSLKVKDETTFDIGFHYPNDITFYDYAQVYTVRKFSGREIAIRYVKSYYIDSINVE